MILEVSDICTSYGENRILFGVSLTVNKGEVVTLLGRNGVGKTTTLRSIMGLTPPESGSIKFMGQEIAGKRAYQIARLGIGFVPEDRRIFPNLTVRDNLEVAEKLSQSEDKVWTIGKVYDLFPKLKELDNHLGKFLSGGEQQMLTIARTLMGNPMLLLLDEPTEGLAPILVNILGRFMARIRDQGYTMFISEQKMKFALDFSNRIYIIHKGKICYEGSPEELRVDEEVKKKYLAV
jgi:branched-chain amino acid transport system ATP-binding protein